MRPPRELSLQCEDARLQLELESLEATIALLDHLLPDRLPPGSIDVAMVSPESCARLHMEFFDDPEITDVMTFPGDPEDLHAGDIAICPQVALSASKAHESSFAEELTLYLVHACLHLAGWDDQTGPQQAEMRKAEQFCMDHLRSAEKLLAAAWVSTRTPSGE